MSYFASLPQIIITDPNGNQTLATNIVARADIIPSLINNPQLFYAYDMQETDTVDIMATKYYKDPYKYWLFLYGNNLLDPNWDFPVSNDVFIAYLNDKYGVAAAANNQGVLAYTQSTTYQYQMVITSTDSTTGIVTINTYNIDANTYGNTATGTYTTTFSDGSTCTITTTTQIESIYTYEYNANEAKRSIQVIDAKYASDMENTLQSLMGT